LIAVQLYTLRDQLQDPARVGGVLGRLREIGYQAVEVAGLGPRVHEGFAAELARAGLVACGAHVPLERLVADLDAVGAQCNEWGCRYVVLPSLPDEYRTQDGYRRFASESAALAQGLRSFGLQLAYHNHSYELERYGRQTALELLLASTSTDSLQAELDTYWLQYGGASPAAWIRRYRGRVPLVHLKDMVVVQGRPIDAEIGEGNLDWAEILAACRDAGTEWLVVEQDAPRRDPMESVAISYVNLERLTAEVESKASIAE
jgi:sugar phosphate isomerase/epimerase